MSTDPATSQIKYLSHSLKAGPASSLLLASAPASPAGRPVTFPRKISFKNPPSPTRSLIQRWSAVQCQECQCQDDVPAGGIINKAWGLTLNVPRTTNREYTAVTSLQLATTPCVQADLSSSLRIVGYSTLCTYSSAGPGLLPRAPIWTVQL